MREVAVGQRKYRFSLWCLLCGTVLGAMGIFYGRELVGVAAVITSILGATGVPFAWGNRAEHLEKPPVKVAGTPP